MSLTVLYWILIAVMLVGVAGTILPLVPGPSLILAAIAVWCVATGFTNIGWPIITVFAVLILSGAVEFIGTYWGAKQAGASSWGQFGAVLGMVLGFIGLIPALPLGGPILGLLLGAVLGAFIGEFLYRRNLDFNSRVKLALKVSLAVVVGTLIGNVIEFILAIAAVIIFVWSTWPQVSAL